MDPTWQIVLAVVAALGGISGVAAFVSSLSAARRNRVDGLATVVETLRSDYERLVTENRGLQAEVGQLRELVEDLEHEVHLWQERYRRLWEWARGNGLDPPEDVLNDEG